VKLALSGEFPSVPPKAYFLTKIFHPNVSKTGEICVNTLKKDWKADMGLAHIFTVIKCLLIHPNPASALNEDAGKLLLENFEDFESHARMMTEIHARPAPAAGAAEEEADEPEEGEEEGEDGDKVRLLPQHCFPVVFPSVLLALFLTLPTPLSSQKKKAGDKKAAAKKKPAKKTGLKRL
jgi:hypothetical protein